MQANFLKNIINSKFRIMILGLVFLTLSYFIFGFFYIRYESLYTALGSGSLTPGMKYDDLYYFVHILLIKFYALLYDFMPHIAWLSIFQYAYLLIGYIVIVHVFKKNKVYFVLLWSSIFIMSSFFIEHYIFHLNTNVSFILSFCALFGLIYSKSLKQLTKTKIGIYYFLFTIGLLTRPESGFMMLAIASLFYFLVLDEQTILNKIKSSIFLFALPYLACLAIFFWFAHDIKTADEFYKNIEPDVEHELTARNNIVPLSEMKTQKDTLRYTAVDMVLWSDATTNDAEFLRSLMLYKHYDFFSLKLLDFAILSLKSSFQKNLPAFAFNIFIFIVLIATFFRYNNSKTASICLFQLAFYLIIFIVGYKVKITETAVSTLLFASSVLLLVFLLIHIENKSKFKQISLAAIFLFFSAYQLTKLYIDSNELKDDYYQNKKHRTYIEQVTYGKNLFLNSESSHIYLQSYRPFVAFDFSNLNQLYLYGEQHITSVEPYRTYLSKVCNCDPNHFGEFFSFIKSGGSQNIFIMSNDFKEFITEYLLVVHELEIKWLELPYKNILTRKFYNEESIELKFFSPIKIQNE